MSPIGRTVLVLALIPTFDSPQVAKARLPTQPFDWWIVVFEKILSWVVTF
jgi:hypothetical protein